MPDKGLPEIIKEVVEQQGWKLGEIIDPCWDSVDTGVDIGTDTELATHRVLARDSNKDDIPLIFIDYGEVQDGTTE